mgnify:CR=1 FL=1|jgi:hypothetical protein
MQALERIATVTADGQLSLNEHTPLVAGQQVRLLILMPEIRTSPGTGTEKSHKRFIKGSWGGALAKYNQQYTSVELCHLAQEWWGAGRVSG